MRLYDTKPYSRARDAIVLTIYEEAYKFKKLPKRVRGEEHSEQWRELVRGVQKEMEWGSSEILFFISLVREYTRKAVRRYLLDNGSKMVRKGKRTYIRKKRKGK